MPVSKTADVPSYFGIGNLWRIAVDHPESPVPSCIHRAPANLRGGRPRLLLINQQTPAFQKRRNFNGCHPFQHAGAVAFTATYQPKSFFGDDPFVKACRADSNTSASFDHQDCRLQASRTSRPCSVNESMKASADPSPAATSVFRFSP